MVDYVPDAFSASFGGMTWRSHRMGELWVVLVYDFGPNVCAAGQGDTLEEAKANTRKVAWGYQLRLDFLRGIPEARREEIGRWLWSLTPNQKTMICELMDEFARTEKGGR